MPLTLTSLSQVMALDYDDIIDVRAPAEWAEDHIPGAISLPVLDDAERAARRHDLQAGQPVPRAQARRGAGGAQRREAPAKARWPTSRAAGARWSIAGAAGSVRAPSPRSSARSAGGSRSWRAATRPTARWSSHALYDDPLPSRVIVLDGNTGTAKTELLALMAGQGVQVIDLEGLANHRGSLFGARAGGQPSQKAFEGRLALALARLDPARPVVVEAESSKIGTLSLPPRLWRAMVAAPRVAVAAPLDQRAAYLTRAYADLTADAAELAAVIDRLRPLHPAERDRRLAGAGRRRRLRSRSRMT